MMTYTTIGQSQRDTETGEPDDATSITSGSEGGREKRPAMDLARGLPTNVAERQLRDGMIRGTGDPDSDLRPQANDRPGQSDAAWQAQWQAQREWYAAHEQQERARQAQHQRHLNGR